MAIFDSTVPKIDVYVDGVLENGTASTIDGTNDKSTTSPLYIGVNNGGTQHPFIGLLDDVRVYNYALTSEQVKQVMNEGSAIRFGE